MALPNRALVPCLGPRAAVSASRPLLSSLVPCRLSSLFSLAGCSLSRSNIGAFSQKFGVGIHFNPQWGKLSSRPLTLERAVVDPHSGRGHPDRAPDPQIGGPGPRTQGSRPGRAKRAKRAISWGRTLPAFWRKGGVKVARAQRHLRGRRGPWADTSWAGHRYMGRSGPSGHFCGHYPSACVVCARLLAAEYGSSAYIQFMCVLHIGKHQVKSLMSCNPCSPTVSCLAAVV